MIQNKRVTLVARPSGNPERTQFGLDTTTIDPNSLKEGEILVKTHFLSLDPYLIIPMGRAGVHGEKVEHKPLPFKLKQFKDAVNIVDIGDVFGGRGVGQVIASKHNAVQVGDFVAADWRWQEYAIVNVDEEATFEVLDKDIFSDPKIALSNALGILSVSGSHALIGYQWLQLQKGQTIAISAAAGNIGIIVAQLAKNDGVNVIAIVGGEEKAQQVKKDFNFDHVVDYKKNLAEQLKQAAPNGIDAYFDNVSGPVSDVVNAHLKDGARVYIAGAISLYGEGKVVEVGKEREEVFKQKHIESVTCQGVDYISKIPASRRTLYELIKQDKLRALEWITKGIEHTAEAFEQMYKGKNYGKSIIQV